MKDLKCIDTIRFFVSLGMTGCCLQTFYEFIKYQNSKIKKDNLCEDDPIMSPSPLAGEGQGEGEVISTELLFYLKELLVPAS